MTKVRFLCLFGNKSPSELLVHKVYNFWEPLHYLDRGYGFQTWETSPLYAIRSWAYIALHLYPATFLTRLLKLDKVNGTLKYLKQEEKRSN